MVDLKDNTSAIVLLIGVFVALLIGFILMSPVFSELNTAYTSTYVANASAVFHNNQPFIQLIGLGFILAVVFIPLVLLGVFAVKANKSGVFDLSELMSRIVVILVMIFVAVIVYLILLPIGASAYTAISAYSWASGYLALVQLAPMLFILGVAGMSIFEGVSIVKELSSR